MSDSLTTAFTVAYRPATDKHPARFLVRCINIDRTKCVPYDHGHNSPPRKAIHDAFGDDVAALHHVGLIESGTALYVRA